MRLARSKPQHPIRGPITYSMPLYTVSVQSGKKEKLLWRVLIELLTRGSSLSDTCPSAPRQIPSTFDSVHLCFTREALLMRLQNLCRICVWSADLLLHRLHDQKPRTELPDELLQVYLSVFSCTIAEFKGLLLGIPTRVIGWTDRDTRHYGACLFAMHCLLRMAT